ncbi:MAG: tetratricopeptide repeat protein, partial [Terriglobales bacterium]
MFDATMHFPLGTRGRYLFAFGCLLFSLLYVGRAGRWFLADRLSNSLDLASLERAVQLEPGNAEVHQRLGRYYFFGLGQTEAAAEHFQHAVDLNPHKARHWLNLALVHQITGDSAAQGQVVQRALLAEPANPAVAMEAANFFLVQGNTTE